MLEKESPKILVTDLDGTLFYPKRKLTLIPKKSIEFLQDFIDKGNKVVVASGRNFDFGKKVAKKLNRKIDFFGCNGMLIYKENNKIFEKAFVYEEIKAYLDNVLEKFEPTTFAIMTDKHNLIVCPLKYRFMMRIGYPIWANSQGVYKEPYKLVNKDTFNNILKSDKIYKVMIFFGLGKKAVSKATIVATYLRKHYDLYEASSSSISIELTPKGINKGEAVDIYLKNSPELNKDRVYVVGDSGNDVPMFRKYYENSFCMSHSRSGVQKNAKNIIDSFSDLKNYLS